MTGEGMVLDDITTADAIAMVSRATDTLLNDSLAPFIDDNSVALMREWETTKRRMAAVEHRMVAQVNRRALPEKAGWKNHTAKYLEQTLRIGHADAHGRVTAEQALGVRQEAGQILEPVLAWTAAIQEMGLISTDHVRQIAKVMKRIPQGVDAVLRAEAARDVSRPALTPGYAPPRTHEGERDPRTIDAGGSFGCCSSGWLYRMPRALQCSHRNGYGGGEGLPRVGAAPGVAGGPRLADAVNPPRAQPYPVAVGVGSWCAQRNDYRATVVFGDEFAGSDRFAELSDAVECGRHGRHLNRVGRHMVRPRSGRCPCSTPTATRWRSRGISLD
ncbi:DUF222 domain-containing protein [Nocardia seriolae]|nr:DUF222 domain-containing protein [Nocardia seriolae]MTJ74154.1 DUF222 domain-containing protein [Nocardia seriolae]MTJ90182.1 DUF222 domain-containing protein [Nocardia seriolae]MTK34145.1 DUF222 domain-containing protein [Nocardia seriolae]MTK43281.1 DUF222 domain-containing protein [Nocardia seriolae]